MRIPRLCTHKASGKAYVTDPATGKETYFGPAGSPEAEARYGRWVAEFTARGRAGPAPPAEGLTVGQLVVAYLKHVDAEYVKDGRPTSEPRTVRTALAPAHDVYELTPAADFGPAALKAVREKYVAAGWKRPHVNAQVRRLRQMFRWAVEMELLPVERLLALRAVRSLRKGKTPAPEGRKVPPVPAADLEAALAALRPRWQTVVRLHLLAACRAQDVLGVRGRDIDRAAHAPLWLYTPAHFKTEHHEGAARRIFLGARCQELLAPLLAAAGPDDWLFPRRDRAGPVSVATYNSAVNRACKRAGVPLWSPLQLRHTALTEVRQRFGLEGAQVRGGHKHAKTTEMYAERDEELARKIAKEMG
jgi:integrase